MSPKDYLEEVGVSLKDLWDVASAHLEISRQDIMLRHDKNIRFHDYCAGEKVWLKSDFIKTGENKLAPKRGGPWTILKKMPNGVTFQIRDDKTNTTKIIHHDRLKPVRHGIALGIPECSRSVPSSSSESSAEYSNYSPSETDTSDSDSERGGGVENRYPVKDRRQRIIPGAIPWDAVLRV